MFALIKEDIQSIFHRDPAARSSWEILTCYPGLHAVWAHRVSHWLWTQQFHWLARIHANWARFVTGIEIHPGAKIGRRLFIDHGMGVVIGETAEIGDDCTLYHGVTLGGVSWNKGKRHPTLGNNVVVGAGAKILGPFTVGEGARIGSNSVVVKEVPPGVTMVGIPARVVSPPAEPRDAVVKMAQSLGFDAYGLSRDMPDPVATAFNAMLDHIHRLDQKLVQVCGALHEIDERNPKLDVERLELPEFCARAAHAQEALTPSAASESIAGNEPVTGNESANGNGAVNGQP